MRPRCSAAAPSRGSSFNAAANASAARTNPCDCSSWGAIMSADSPGRGTRPATFPLDSNCTPRTYRVRAAFLLQNAVPYARTRFASPAAPSSWQRWNGHCASATRNLPARWRARRHVPGGAAPRPGVGRRLAYRGHAPGGSPHPSAASPRHAARPTSCPIGRRARCRRRQ